MKLKAPFTSREVRNYDTTICQMLYLEPLHIHVGPGQLTLKCDLVLLSYADVCQRFADSHRQFCKRGERTVSGELGLPDHLA